MILVSLRLTGVWGGGDGVGGIRHSISVDVPGCCMDISKEKGIHTWGSGLLAGEGWRVGWGQHRHWVSTPSYLRGRVRSWPVRLLLLLLLSHFSRVRLCATP